ncbi:hypothetical protein [Tenacibaculum aestuariivivum]|uniref:hypothetical protein n=1 Tax=Tenacibaculum aestuariivivum TaxID=2006131 RepID=UPI003AB8B127
MLEIKENHLIIENKSFEYELMEYSNRDSTIYLELDTLDEFDFNLIDLPESKEFEIVLTRGNEIKSQFNQSIKFNRFYAKKSNSEPIVRIDLFKYYLDSYDGWTLKWDIKKYIEHVLIKLESSRSLVILEKEIDSQSIGAIIGINSSDIKTFKKAIIYGLQELNIIFKISEIELGGFVWKPEYEKNESLFSTEIVNTLLNKLNYDNVIYNHGVKEYGKDFIFSEIDRLGLTKYTAIQVKAGNLRGNVKSDIDEILAQADDAFSMPFSLLGSSNKLYISTFIILISGKFTDNAKDKIAEKIEKKLIGNIFFIDKSMIINLIERLKDEK